LPTRLGEFDIISRFFAPLAAGEAGALGLLDDAALVDLPPGKTMVVTTDAIVAGIHFPVEVEPKLIAGKLIGVNLSDLAAMGAQPLAYLLVLALPSAWSGCELENWLEVFTAGLAEHQAGHGISLIGGDTVATPGPLTLTMTALGSVERGRALRRQGAEVGDLVFVSGTIGDAALGLRVAKGKLPHLAADHRSALLDRLSTPRPRLGLGRRLCGVATAVADVSDGLIADLGRICAASGVSAVIDAERVPLSPAAAAAIGNDPALLPLALGGGDDYELIFTSPAAAAPRICVIAGELDLPLAMIGRIVGVSGADGPVRVLYHGAPFAVPIAGWQHFR
jgi:thiamine-monophosphate kinase